MLLSKASISVLLSKPGAMWERKITREEIQNPPQDPWRSCRAVVFESDDEDHGEFQDVTDEDIRRWLDKAGPYVESMEASASFWTLDRISLLFGSGFCQTPRLKELLVRGNIPEEPLCSGGALLLALDQAPWLETLSLTHVPFSSPGPVEGFLSRSKTLKTLILNDVQIAATGVEPTTEETTAAAVSHAFRRGIVQNKSLSHIRLG